MDGELLNTKNGSHPVSANCEAVAMISAENDPLHQPGNPRTQTLLSAIKLEDWEKRAQLRGLI